MSDHTDPTQHLDPAFVRGLTEPRLSRGQLLRAAGVGAAALSMGGLLSEAARGATKDTPNWKQFWAEQKKNGEFTFANWPLYIDVDHGKHPSLDQFTKATGIKVTYKEVVQNNDSFYAKISPTLRAGQSTGYDIIVMTNGWYLTEMINHDWLIPLDKKRLKNFYRFAAPTVKNPAYDRKNKYTVAWQSGLTGIAYDPKLTKRKITSIHDLWDPAFKGHVGMMSDNTELGSAGLLALGINPPKSNQKQWDRAAALLKKQRDAGLVRQYYDQGYIKALERGDVWLTQAWSGDIFQANASGYPHLKFVVPKEGVMQWTDTMSIPVGADNPVDALAWMNFYYQPKIAAEVADWVNYITPVPAAKRILMKEDPAVGKSPLVFPTPAMFRKMRDYYVFKDYDDFQAWNETFNPIIQS